MAREGRGGELEFEDVCNQLPSDTHTEEEAIRSVGPQVIPNYTIFSKILLQTLFCPVKIIARRVTGE